MIPDVIFWDTESYTLNSYSPKAKLLSSQIGWFDYNEGFNYYYYSVLSLPNNNMMSNNLPEFDVIANTLNRLSKYPKYTHIFTYNGMHDILYIMGRLNKNLQEMVKNDKSINYDRQLEIANNIFTSHIKHCDMMQFDKGKFVGLDRICNKYSIWSDCPDINGSKIAELYDNDEHGKIMLHGIDDIKRLCRLVNSTNLADKFHKVGI